MLWPVGCRSVTQRPIVFLDLAAVTAWMREVAGPLVADDVPPPLRAIMDARYDYDDGPYERTSS